MGTINKGTRSVLSPSESALAVGKAFSGPGSGERLGVGGRGTPTCLQMGLLGILEKWPLPTPRF